MLIQRFISAVLIGAVVLTLNGCGLAYTLYEDNRAVDRTVDFQTLKIGMTTAEVLDTVGKPNTWDEDHWTYRSFFDVDGQREYRDVELYFKKDQLIVAEGVPGAPLAQIDRRVTPMVVNAENRRRETAIGKPVSSTATSPDPAPVPGSEISQSAVIAAVQAWAEAWSHQNVDQYLDAYINTYAPRGLSHEQWVQQRRTRVARPEWIDVTMDELNVRVNGPGSATATFLQHYKSNGYKDETAKTLELRRIGTTWKITSEKAGRVSMASGRAPAPQKLPMAIAETSDSDQMGIRAAVLAWADAWSAKDIDAYVASYIPDYAPAGQSHAAWLSQRKQRLTRPTFIEVSLDELQVAVDGLDHAHATFRQIYRSDRFSDRDTKRLEFERLNGQWRIAEEKSGVRLPTLAAVTATAKATEAPVSLAKAPPSQSNKPAVPVDAAAPEAPTAPAAIAVTIPAASARATDEAGQSISARRAQIRRAVEDWLTAWTAQNADAYIQAYAADYAPDGKTHAQWVADRKRKLKGAADIQITLSEEIIRLRGENAAVVRFRQLYESKNYRDRVSKELEIRRIDGNWKITRESSR